MRKTNGDVYISIDYQAVANTVNSCFERQPLYVVPHISALHRSHVKGPHIQEHTPLYVGAFTMGTIERAYM